MNRIFNLPNIIIVIIGSALLQITFHTAYRTKIRGSLKNQTSRSVSQALLSEPCDIYGRMSPNEKYYNR
ncbi:hypothetical protein WN51_05445 [Melipona quadrifasciata]|uniref:Uncharacterized protein n=1 Tax=Melipona quadrifasciata TaxID=166423 RepID=A0A0N0BKL0_9HYME|nr:hypothetical protein WN51_05445 [Melipona quadrifasciata]